MNDLIKALESSIENKNWFASLFIALSIPDICGYLQSPHELSQIRYKIWFEKYMLKKYSSPVGISDTPHIFLSPSDCYALRCAILHEGREEITDQSAREALDRFHFSEPPHEGSVHCNQINNVLQLQVDTFCDDMLSGLREWFKNVKEDMVIMTRIRNMLKVYPYNPYMEGIGGFISK
jgi:hypothetical protein